MCVSAENEVLLQLSQDVDCKYSAVSGGVQMCRVHTSHLYSRERSGEAVPGVWRAVGMSCLGMFHLCVARKESVGFFSVCVFTDTAGNNRKKDDFVLGSINKGFSGANTKLLLYCFL